VGAGFEYFRDAVAAQELEADVLAKIGDREILISLVTHSDLRELLTSIIASAVLCGLTDGVVWDTEGNEFFGAAEALTWARETETAIKGEL
jgi:hypothetical protein